MTIKLTQEQDLEREHEMSLANNARDMLEQVDKASARIADDPGCAKTGKPIGKYRLQAFPVPRCVERARKPKSVLVTGGRGRRLAKCFEAPIDPCWRCLPAPPWASS